MLPKFTIKQSLLAMVLFAFLAFCLASAWRGSVVGFGIAAGLLVFLLVIPIVFAVVYWVGFGLASIFSSARPGGTKS